MKFKIQIMKSDEGFAVSCPSLPGCHSQGENEHEALENIKEAIILWMETFAELQDELSDVKGYMLKEIEIPIGEQVFHA
ncbi:MAG: type II toxin-antitoxin system HicB family antitoxin [Desulfococcaceae bacterium]|jgi:predicted RNase H-like HicB family nuclease|nr:type II toxin-antitoxin system HicB family antitoxin [Desulfococcaceae bacterium]